MVRKLDNLGRIVIPIEFRKEHNWENNCKIDIASEGDKIILSKNEDKCIFCNNKATEGFKEKKICKKCREELKNE